MLNDNHILNEDYCITRDNKPHSFNSKLDEKSVFESLKGCVVSHVKWKIISKHRHAT